MGMLDRFGQFSRGARRILKQRQCVGRGVGREMRGKAFEPAQEGIVGNDDLRADTGKLRRLFGVGHDQAGLAIVDAQLDAIGSEQREQRHGDGARLHRAEHRYIERPRRLQHDCDAIACLDAFAL